MYSMATVETEVILKVWELDCSNGIPSLKW